MKDELYYIRALLINIGKALPFILCFIIFVSYAETAFALATSDFLLYDGMIIPNKPLSWLLGNFFEYNIQLLAVITVLTVAVRTCVWNKMAVAYLYINLFEKQIFVFEMYIEYIWMIVIVNMVISLLIVYKGIKILIR